MSITASFYSGLSGLSAQATAMQVIGDNIANVHTTGFKGSTVHFADVLGVALTGVSGGNQTGAGTEVTSVDLNFIQGSLNTTNLSTDLAINGRGFFVVKEASTEEIFYTRAGHFNFDNQGYFVDPLGYRVQGYLYDATGTSLFENLADIWVNKNSMIDPKVTGEIDMVLNLNASETVKTWDADRPYDTSNFATSLSIFDSLGQSHPIQIFFTKSAGGVWDWYAMIDGSELDGGTAGELVEFGSGTIEFDSSGKLTTTMPLTFHSGGLTYANGCPSSACEIDFTGTTQFGSPSVVQIVNQDGYTAGTISQVNIDEEGNMVAYYTNGKRQKIARLVVADFPNLSGLSRKGANLYQATTTSGDPIYNKPGVGGMGNIFASMLEESNVDIAAELIKMIITQRGYQANIKVISTTDEMLAQLMNIR